MGQGRWLNYGKRRFQTDKYVILLDVFSALDSGIELWKSFLMGYYFTTYTHVSHNNVYAVVRVLRFRYTKAHVVEIDMDI